MRQLSDCPNLIKIQDGISGEVKKFTYRTPTPMEHQVYVAKCLGLRGNKAIISRKTISDARVEFGLKIILGIEDGDFGDAEGKPISSNPESPNYRTDWKDLLKKFAPDLLALLAVAVFDGTRVIADSDPLVEIEEDAEEVVPFEKNSAGSGSESAPKS